MRFNDTVIADKQYVLKHKKLKLMWLCIAILIASGDKHAVIKKVYVSNFLRDLMFLQGGVAHDQF